MRRFLLMAVLTATITIFLGAMTMAGGLTISNFIERSALQWESVDVENFIPSQGVYFQADVSKGVGYLINQENRTFTKFPILSGQRQYVCYIGRCYYGATPEQEWIVKEMNIQYDRITFSESGKFLRLYANGDTRTSYGIHGHAHFDYMLQKDTIFQSMGCILVSDDVMDVIEASFYANGNTISVLTFS